MSDLDGPKCRILSRDNSRQLGSNTGRKTKQERCSQVILEVVLTVNLLEVKLTLLNSPQGVFLRSFNCFVTTATLMSIDYLPLVYQTQHLGEKKKVNNLWRHPGVASVTWVTRTNIANKTSS